MNAADMLRLMSAKRKFQENHPKFPLFLRAVYQRALKEGTLIEIKVTTPEGTELSSNLKVQQSDLELLQEVMKMGQP